MLVVDLVTLIAIALLLTSYALFNHSRLIRKSAEVDGSLFEDTGIDIELEPTTVRKIGNGLRYIFYLSDLLVRATRNRVRRSYTKIREALGVETPDGLRRFRNWDSRWRREGFFPSFKDWHQELKRSRRIRAVVHSALYRSSFGETVHLIGTMRLPRRVYVNDSDIVELSLVPELDLGRTLPKLSVERDEDGGVRIQVNRDRFGGSLEVNLTGVGVEVTPIDPEIQSGQYVFFSWGCAFPHSGLQTLVLRITVHSHHKTSAGTSSTQRVKHRVKVNQIDHLTSRQVRVFASAAAVLGVLGTIIGILKALEL